MVIFHTYAKLPEGKSSIKIPFNHHFPMVFPWFSYGFPMVFPIYQRVTPSLPPMLSIPGQAAKDETAEPWGVTRAAEMGLGHKDVFS